MATNQQLPPAYTPPTSERRTGPGAPAMNSAFDFGHNKKKKALLLYRHWSTLLCTVFFLALIVVPWVLLNVLNIKPIGGKGEAKAMSWDVVDGSIGEEAVHTSQGLYRFASVANVVAALLTVPAIGMVLNHAAVVVVQRRHSGQRLNALEMLSLADAPWSRLPPSFQLAYAPPRFAYGSLALVAVGLLQSILQSALVTSERITVATPNDVLYSSALEDDHDSRYRILGHDAYPGTLSRVPINIVLSELTTRLAVESEHGIQPRLWIEGYPGPEAWAQPFPELDDQLIGKWNFFASALPSNVDTGVLRYYAMRMNSSIHCELVSRDFFPDTCPGFKPLDGSLSLPVLDKTPRNDDGPFETQVTVRWCVPGEYDSSPWATTRDRQNVSEVFFIDVDRPTLPNGTYSIFFSDGSFTTRCSAKSTRGMFELPNYHNNFRAGPLLEEAPNDNYDENDLDPNPEWSYNGDRIYDYRQPTPGPLMTTMLSMLGNGGWLYPVQNISATSETEVLTSIYRGMCRNGIPLSKISDFEPFSNRDDPCDLFTEDGRPITYDDADDALLDIKKQVYHWFDGFRQVDRVNETLTAALFLANDATLTRAASNRVFGNVIYTSIGASFDKPNISLPAQIIISALLGIEIIALVGLMVFIYGRPTFASRLDTFMLATIGAQLAAAGATLPQLSDVNKRERFHLREYDGVIGLSHGDLADGESSSSSIRERAGRQGARESESQVELNDLSEPTPSNRVLLVGGLGSLVPGSNRSKARANATSTEI